MRTGAISISIENTGDDKLMISCIVTYLCLCYNIRLSRRLTDAYSIPRPWCPSLLFLSSTLFKHLLLKRWVNQRQTSCGAALGRGNESFYKWSNRPGHMTMMAAMPIYEKNLHWNWWPIFNKTWYVASGIHWIFHDVF